MILLFLEYDRVFSPPFRRRIREKRGGREEKRRRKG